tara:strand:- start:12776 stop:13201 length:426 start_codon:yes stop_codon:yes gene_type:complete
MGFLDKLKEKLAAEESNVVEEDLPEHYVELDADNIDHKESKIMVKPFVIEVYDDVKFILDSLRDGKMIALINIKPLKDKDVIELKRAINKLKKTCDAIEGDIAGFGDNWIAAVPSFAYIHRGKKPTPPTPAQGQEAEMNAE